MRIGCPVKAVKHIEVKYFHYCGGNQFRLPEVCVEHSILLYIIVLYCWMLYQFEIKVMCDQDGAYSDH